MSTQHTPANVRITAEQLERWAEEICKEEGPSVVGAVAEVHQ